MAKSDGTVFVSFHTDSSLHVVEKVVEVPKAAVEVKKEPILEEVKKPIEVPKEVIKPQREFTAEELSLVPPPEEEIPMEIPVAKKVSLTPAPQQTIKVDAKRTWGGIVRRLRTTPNKTILWVACQEMSASVDGGVLTICASTENEKKLLLSKDNYETLIEISKDFGIEKINVEMKSGESQGEDPLKKAQAFFGDTLKVK